MKLRLLILFVISIFISCEEIDVNKRDYPLVQTVDLQFVGQNIEFSGEILSTNNYDVTDHGFVWDEQISTIETGNVISLGPTTEAKKFNSTIQLTQITAGKTYYMRTYVQGNGLTVYGDAIGFRK